MPIVPLAETICGRQTSRMIQDPNRRDVIGFASMKCRRFDLPTLIVQSYRDDLDRHVRRVRPIVRHPPDRIEPRRRPVCVTRRTEYRFTQGRRTPAPFTAQRSVIVGRELHEQVLRLLAIVNGVALPHFSGREKADGPAAGHRPWFRAEHGPNAESPTAKVSAGQRRRSQPRQGRWVPYIAWLSAATNCPTLSGGRQEPCRHC